MDSSKILFKLINIILAAVLIFFAAAWWIKPGTAQGPVTASKIGSRLDLQVKEKNRYLATSGKMQAAGVDFPQFAGKSPAEVSRQKIFLHLKQFPTTSQVRELQALGVTLYPDSWIPPVGAHTTGFMYAEAPVSQVQNLAARNYITSVETAEVNSKPKNDLAAVAMNVNNVPTQFNGTGVTVAVLDSGLDLTHPDIPTPVQVWNYSAWPTITSTNIANTVTGHGTHVTGSVVGRGTQSGGTYKGIAPGASLVFLKIGRDSDAVATSGAMVNAIKAAVDSYGAKVITMSYGSWSTYHDGSSELSQAVDYAVGKGAVFFGSAGNEANLGLHYSGAVNGGDSTDWIRVNVTGAAASAAFLAFNMVWFDGLGPHNTLSLEYYSANSANSPSNRIFTIESSAQTESSRGTESQLSRNTAVLPAGNSVWYLKVNNSSPNTQLFHLYYDDFWNTGAAKVVFASPDQSYTILDPAEADGAIAVGAYVTRTSWTNYQGGSYGISESGGSVASFSSRGPRVDTGAPGKPNIVAPGSVIISLRDKDMYPWPGGWDAQIISNNGVNNGLGPADYIIKQGTSMASPLAAGVGALLLSKALTLSPSQVKNYLEITATDKGTLGWDNAYGWGLINAQAAVNAVQFQIPAASFTKSLNPPNGLAQCTVTFTDTSSGPPQTWSWSFGDGTSSSSQNPTKVYNNPGNYTVTLTVTNPAGSSSTSQMVGIYGTPISSFTKSVIPSNGVAPVTVSFTDNSTGNIVSWLWNFGDGSTSSTQNPSKVYSSAGNYTVSLTVTNPVGSNSASQTVSVYSTPAAGFTKTLNPPSGTAPVTVSFTDTSTGNPTTWYWNFGDGTASMSQNPSKTYNAAGIYNVSLSITNPAGISSASQTVTVYLFPSASFTASTFSGIAPLTVNFTDTSPENIVSWSWNFGDGTGSTSKNSTKVYNNAGSYLVALTVTNPAGSNTASATVQVYSAPVASFTPSTTVNSPGSPITFTDTSTGNPVSWSWTFGDGTTSSSINPNKAYAAGGTYTVTLTVTNPAGTNTLTRSNYITITGFKSETALSQGVSGGLAYVAGKINRFFDPNTMGTVTLSDGIGSFDAYMTYPAGAISMKAVTGVGPFSSPTVLLDTFGGSMSTVIASQTVATPQPPLEVFRFYPWLMGSKDTAYTITLHFNTIGRSAGGQVPQNADVSKTFRRGDANNDGFITIVDALFIAQYLAGLRELGETNTTVNPLNSATARNDSPTSGSSITIADALFIAQMLAELRDAWYNLF